MSKELKVQIVQIVTTRDKAFVKVTHPNARNTVVLIFPLEDWNRMYKSKLEEEERKAKQKDRERALFQGGVKCDYHPSVTVGKGGVCPRWYFCPDRNRPRCVAVRGKD